VSKFDLLNPASLGVPKGWTNGVLAPPGGRMLFVAGQAGWETETPGEPPGFAAQFARALDKILVVVREAGGDAGCVARLTVFVSDMPAYLESRRELRDVWSSRFGRYYPAMALVEVKGLVDRGAKVEIEATAVIGGPA
jgi:enamine deaminase RidA (YjgF/YER057c/UK114 family)